MTDSELIDRLREIGREHKLLVWAAGLTVAAVGMLFLVAWPLWQQGEEKRAEKTKLQQTLNVLQQRTGIVSKISTEQKQLFGLAELSLPLHKQPLLAINALRDIMAESGVTIQKYELSPGVISTDAAALAATSKVGGSASGGQISRMSIAMEVLGTLSQLRQTLAMMENAIPLFDVADMSVLPMRTGNNEDELSRNYRLTMQIMTFYANFDPAQLVKGGAQPLTGAQQNLQKKLQAMQVWVSAAASGAAVPTTDYGRNDLFNPETVLAPPDSAPATAAATPAE